MDGFSSMLWMLGTFAVPGLIIYLFVRRVGSGIRKEQEKRYAPLQEWVAEYALKNNFTLLPADTYTTYGLLRLRRFLPPGLPTFKGKPVIPLYYFDDNTRGMYRPAFILRKIRAGREMRLFIIPLYKQSEGTYKGVVYVAGQIPSTGHWLKLYREAWPKDSNDDHNLESNTFNRKYWLTGSNPTLLTEIFDPLLIERLNNKSSYSFLGRIRSQVVEFAESGQLQPILLDEVVQLFEELERRFLKAYQSYPEPVKK